MLSALAKLLLVSTSLAPVLGALAVINISDGKHWLEWAVWLGIAAILIFLCWSLLLYAAKNAPEDSLAISEFERADQEVLAFLLAYLLPFISTDSVVFVKGWLVGAYIFVLICWVIAHVGAFHFNPVMWLLGYHFYSVKDEKGVSQVLISHGRLRQAGKEVTIVRIADNICLSTGG